MAIAEPAAMANATPEKYEQRRPDKTVLYRVIQQHLTSFLEYARESSGKRLPRYVEDEFRRYLAVCEACGDELLLPFSCKRRGICHAATPGACRHGGRRT